MKSVDRKVLDDLIKNAQGSPRQRAHYNIHEELTDPVNRLCVAFEPGSYIRPHIHKDKWELFILFQGASVALVFDDNGIVTERIELNAKDGARIIEFPEKCIHSIVIKEPGTVMMEVKPGPYKKPTEEDFAPWAPKEGEEGAVEFERWMARSEVEDSFEE